MDGEGYCGFDVVQRSVRRTRNLASLVLRWRKKAKFKLFKETWGQVSHAGNDVISLGTTIGQGTKKYLFAI